MENAWPDTELGRDLKKKSVNSLIGLMSVDESSVWMVKSCLTDESENMGQFTLKTLVESNHGNVTDFYYQTILDNSYRSMRPIWDICVHTEVTRLAQAYHIITSLEVPAKDICTYKTDSIGFYARKKRKAECLQIAQTTFRDLKRQKRLTHEVSSTASLQPVFRVEEKKITVTDQHQTTCYQSKSSYRRNMGLDDL